VKKSTSQKLFAGPTVRSTPPESLLSAIIDTLFHRYYGMEALALASIVERDKFSDRIVGLPNAYYCAEMPVCPICKSPERVPSEDVRHSRAW
jgi:hypothetical protein